MAFPSKGTREITVRDQRYMWHLSNNRIDEEARHVSIRSAVEPGAMLFVDPYPWEFEIRPANVSAAIEFALDHGWDPGAAGAPMYVSFRDGSFFQLPPGKRFAYEVPPP